MDFPHVAPTGAGMTRNAKSYHVKARLPWRWGVLYAAAKGPAMGEEPPPYTLSQGKGPASLFTRKHAQALAVRLRKWGFRVTVEKADEDEIRKREAA